jgi:hypothetical protein
MCAVGSNLIITPTAIARTSVQKYIGGYRASLPHSGDMEMWLRFAAHGAVAKLDVVQAIYRKHRSNMSDPYYENWSDYLHRKKAFDNFFEANAKSIPGSDSLRRQADRMLAKEVFRCGTNLVRSGIRLSQRDRISTGIQLLRWSVGLNPRLCYWPPVLEMLKFPGPEGRRWAVSVIMGAAAKVIPRIRE